MPLILEYEEPICYMTTNNEGHIEEYEFAFVRETLDDNSIFSN
jgi:hypothetical protein